MRGPWGVPETDRVKKCANDFYHIFSIYITPLWSSREYITVDLPGCFWTPQVMNGHPRGSCRALLPLSQLRCI